MGEHTRETPKALLDLNGRPMLLHILDRLAAAGTEEVLLVTGYLAEAIEKAASAHRLRVSSVRQEELNGTARAALLGRDFAGGGEFLLTFGDILTDAANYRGMWEAKAGRAGVLGARWVEDPWQGAAIYVDAAQRGERIIEKPARGASTTNWNSAGVYVFGPDIFAELERAPLSERGEYELTTAIAQSLDAGSRMALFPLAGDWLDVGRPEDLERARALFR
jgi:dTDP-glucose pyrophosphorylase